MGSIITFDEANNQWQLTTNEVATFKNEIEITTKGVGLILASPDGTRWSVSVDNDGNLITTEL